MTPLATTKAGEHYFAVYAVLLGTLPALRPGMQGFAKVEIDRQPVLARALKRMGDGLRMLFWSWGL